MKTALHFHSLLESKKLPPELAGVEPLIEIETNQRLGNTGCMMTFTIKNASTGRIELSNPLDYFRIGLQDHEGWPIQLPRSSTRLQMNSQGPMQIQRPFNVVSIRNLNSGLSLLDSLDDQTIELVANASIEYVISIETVQDPPLEDRITATSRTKSIESGRYKFSVQLTLMHFPNSAANIILTTDPIEISLA